jgi:hypothetical protein
MFPVAFPVTQEELSSIPFNLNSIEKRFKYSISGVSYVKYPRKRDALSYQKKEFVNKCGCYNQLEVALDYDIYSDPCEDCKNLLKTIPIDLENGLKVYVSPTTLCYTNLPEKLFDPKYTGQYLWIHGLHWTIFMDTYVIK